MEPRSLARWALVVGLTTLPSFAISQVSPRRQPSEQQTAPSPPAPAPAEPGAAPRKPTVLSLEDRADIFMARKSYADAIEYYRRALKAAGNADPSLWNKLGIAFQQQMNYRAARAAYKEAIRRRKDFPEPWNNMGTVYYIENRPKKSIRYYRHAVKLNPNWASFHINLGTAYTAVRKYEEAVEEFRTALAIDPNCLTARSSLGTVVQARGADVEFYFQLAKVFASLDRAEESVRYLRRAFEDGFKDMKRLQEDPDIQKISHDPAYVELVANPPVAIKD